MLIIRCKGSKKKTKKNHFYLFLLPLHLIFKIYGKCLCTVSVFLGVLKIVHTKILKKSFDLLYSFIFHTKS